MPGLLKFFGRTFELLGLLLLPSAIWAAEFQKSESGAVAIFLGSLGIFFIGWILTKGAKVE